MRLCLRLWAFLAVFISTSFVLAADPWIQAEDIQAGDDIPLKITGLLEGESVKVTLNRPQQKSIVVPFTANSSGSVHAQISGLHTRLIGDYSIDLKRSISSRTFSDTLKVISGPVSAYRSLIQSDENAQAADGKSEFLFEVRAYDAFGNAVQNAPVRVFSGRKNDRIIIQPFTDNLGRASGKVISSRPGVSVLSAIVGETVLQDKKEIIFHIPSEGLPAVGQGLGDFLRAQIFDDESLVGLGYFEIENLPSQVTAGEFIGVRIVAYDTNGQLFNDYEGTIEFASTDNKGELPVEYTFVDEDQGVHEFYLAVRFGTAGDQTLSVRDTTQTSKVGEVAIRVLPAVAIDTPPEVLVPGSITINTPQNGGTYKTKRLTVTGMAPGLSVLQVRFGKAPNYQVATTELEVQEDGSFAYQTPTLIEGYHELSIASLDSDVESLAVSFTIDATAPESMVVSINPEGTKEPNEIFSLNLQSSEDLALVQCVFNEALFDLSSAGGGAYTTQLAAPQECGEYPVGCTIADEVGNQFEEPNATVVKVCGEAPIDPPVVENTPPSPPTNLTGEPGENKVTLLWSPSTDDGDIINYEVNFVEEGTVEIEQNILPDNRTQWYVDGLDACVKYRFTVRSIDNEGVSSIPSEVVEQAPFCPEELRPSPPKTTESGGTFPWYVMAISLVLGGTVVSLFRRA